MKKIRNLLVLLCSFAICIGLTACSDIQQEGSDFQISNSKFPDTLNTNTISEIGDFVVLNSGNPRIDYNGFDYVFADFVSFNYTCSSIDSVSVYSFYENNIIVKNRNLQVLGTVEYNMITDIIFNTKNGWGDAVTFSFDNYDKTNGTFNLLSGEKSVFCVPYDMVDWENCYTVKWGHLDSDALVAVLK